jgi:hypothetical protein
MNHNDTELVEIIDIEIFTIEERVVPLGKRYKVKIDGEYFVFHHHHVTGAEILEKAGKTPVECHSLYVKSRHHGYAKIGLQEKIDLSSHKVEHFEVKGPEEFHFSVNGERETTKEIALTPKQILEIAGIKPIESNYLVQIEQNGVQISYQGKQDELIKMQCPPLKFISIFIGETPVS